MGKFLAVSLFCVAIALFGALGEYVCGRIILPAMGLTAPGYWAWFWFMTIALVFAIPLSLISKALD